MQVPQVTIPHVFIQYGVYAAVHCINVTYRLRLVEYHFDIEKVLIT